MHRHKVSAVIIISIYLTVQGNVILQAQTDIEITDCVFAFNTATYGGAVQVNSNAVVVGCNFNMNECTGAGPAMYVPQEANTTIIDSTFRSRFMNNPVISLIIPLSNRCNGIFGTTNTPPVAGLGAVTAINTTNDDSCPCNIARHHHLFTYLLMRSVLCGPGSYVDGIECFQCTAGSYTEALSNTTNCTVGCES